MKETKKWHKLDNSAKIYPMLINKTSQNLFRLTAEMKANVNPEILQRALFNIMPRFPTFNVSLKRGLFWYYFEQLDGKPLIALDSDVIIKPITSLSTCGFNFRVSYFKKRIAVDFFHAVCDGSGGVEFLKTLLYQYLYEQGIYIESEEKLILPNSPIRLEEQEDSFIKYAQYTKLKDIKNISELRGTKAYLINGLQFDYPGCGIVQGVVNSKKLLALAREKNCTVTAYLGALVLYSIYVTKIKETKPENNLQLFVPINLRKIFPSVTLLNFTMFSRIGFKVEKQDLTFDDFLSRTTESLKRDTNKEKLRAQISTTVKAEKFIPLKLMPLPLKQIIFKIGQLFFGNDNKTLTFSNMGAVSLPSGFSEYVERFSFILGNNKNAPISLSVLSAFDKTTINFARLLQDTEIEKFFFRTLSANGLDVLLYSNNWEDGCNGT